MAEVIHLEFKSPHVDEDMMAFLACKACKNKTFTLTLDKVEDFPLMRCAACGSHIGRMGWYHDDDPECETRDGTDKTGATVTRLSSIARDQNTAREAPDGEAPAG